MYNHADSTAFSYSETSAKTFQTTLHAPVPLSSQSPFPLYPLDSSESGSISSNGPSPEPSHTVSGNNYPHRIDDQLPWSFSITGDPYFHGERPRFQESPLDFTFAPTPYSDSRTRLDQRFSRIRTVGIVFTDDARKKLGDGVHRWCFNCRSTETTTWRRSSLSPGKLLCNRCGLFERTHRVPRPDKFPRRRRARPATVFAIPALSGEQWQCQNHLSSTMPPTQFFQPFDAVQVGEQSIPQNTSWMTQNETGLSLSPLTAGPCFPTSQQQIMYRGDGHI